MQVMEAMLGRAQRMVIQRRLRKLNLYTGKIDAIFGDDTRAAIKQFQGQENATETGYLPPQQLQRLMTVR